MNYIIITRTRRLRRVTETGGFWWVRDWTDNGFDFGRRITKKHALKLTREAVHIYVSKP